jgi:hypothetical protein
LLIQDDLQGVLDGGGGAGEERNWVESQGWNFGGARKKGDRIRELLTAGRICRYPIRSSGSYPG